MAWGHHTMTSHENWRICAYRRKRIHPWCRRGKEWSNMTLIWAHLSVLSIIKSIYLADPPWPLTLVSDMTGVIVWHCVSVFLSVCYHPHSETERHTDLNFCMEDKRKEVKVTNQGPQVKTVFMVFQLHVSTLKEMYRCSYQGSGWGIQHGVFQNVFSNFGLATDGK